MKWLLFILSFTAVTAHAQESMSSTMFCQQLNSVSNPEEKQQYISNNYQKVLQEQANKFGEVSGAFVDYTLSNQVQSGIASNFIMKSSYLAIKKFYDVNPENKLGLFEDLKNAPDVMSCLSVINKELTDKYKMATDLNRNGNELDERGRTIKELKSRVSDPHYDSGACEESVSKTLCSGLTETFQASHGFNEIIKVVAPKANEGGYNKFCDCSKNYEVSFWHFRTNYKNSRQDKGSIKEKIQQELLRKKFFKLIDQYEKNGFIRSLGAKQVSPLLGCGNKGLEESLQQSCKGAKLNQALLSGILSDFLNKSPRNHTPRNTIPELEREIARTQNFSSHCPQMDLNGYSYLMEKDMRNNSEKFFKVYGFLFKELPTLEKNPTDQELSLLYEKTLSVIMNSPEKLKRLSNSLEVSTTAGPDEILDAFKSYHFQTTQNLGFKSILSSPIEMQKVFQAGQVTLPKIIAALSSEETQTVKCEQVINEMAPLVCSDAQDLDLAKYDIDIDALVDQYGYDLSLEEMKGLCAQRRNNKKEENLEKISFTDLPNVVMPDVASYYDPSLAHDENLKKSVMDVYAKNFCSKIPSVNSNLGADRDLISEIMNNPSYYSGYGDFSDYFSPVDPMSRNYLNTAPIDNGSDNGRERFVTTSRRSVQPNETTTPVILSNNKLEMKSYGSVGNVKTAVVNRSPAATLTKPENDDDKKERMVDRYRDLDEDDADYFAKRKELLKQLYSASEVPSTTLNEQDYLAKIKALEDQLSQKENQLNTINGVTPRKSQNVQPSQGSIVGDNTSGFAVMNKQNENVSNGNIEQTNSDRTTSYSGSGKSSLPGDDNHETSHTQGNLNRSRGDGLYLNVTPADFSNPEFIKSMETQIKSLVNSDLDKLVQQLENGPLLIDVNGKKVGVNVEDLKKILDVETLKKIESKLELAKKKKSESGPQKMQKIVEKAKVENEIKEIKSEMYKTLLQLSSKLKSQGKI